MEGAFDAVENAETGIRVSAFKPLHISPMKIALFSEKLLRPASLIAEALQFSCEKLGRR